MVEAMRKSLLLLAAGVASFTLIGCAAAPQPADPPNAAEEPANPSTPDPKAASEGFSFSHIKSCADVEPFLTAWIADLEPYDWNSASDAEVVCGWSNPPEEVTPETARSVEVKLSQVSERPDFSMLESMQGFAWVDDAWVSENDGAAFTMTVDLDISAVIGSTIWVPGVEVTVSGGRWANLPELDGAASLEIAKQILAS